MRRSAPAIRFLVLMALIVSSLVGVGSAPVARAATVSFVGAASAEVPGSGTSLTIPRPAGTGSGHVLVAAVSIVDDDPSFGAPSGWSLVREDLLHDSFRQAVYVRVAGGSEPAGYTWTLPAWRRVAGGIVAYAGVDIAAPVAAHAGLVQGSSATDVTAPSVDTATGGSMLVHLAVSNSESMISPPAGMTERWEAAAWRNDSPRDVTLSASDAVVASAGPTGPRSATASAPGPRAGALIALQPAGGLPPPPPPDGEITVVGSASDSSPEPRTGITINRPAGTAAGDVLVASIGIVDDDPMYQAPSGWAQVRAETLQNSLRVETFVKVAGGSEPPAYTWTLPDWRRIAGGITAYRGVDAANPLDGINAASSPDNGTAITAPSITTATSGAMLVHVAVINAEAAISPPAGMTEAWEATGWRVDSPRDVTISSSHAAQGEAGPTGPRTATASAAGPWIGVLLALRPAAEPGEDTTPPETTITSGPSGTVDTDEATFTFTSSETGSTFQCRLDGEDPEPCTSPQSYAGLPDGEHTFSVAATDPANNTDPTPDNRTWTIDTTEPPPPDGEISVVGSASDSDPNGRTGITINRPGGTQPGDVMVAAIAIVDDDPTSQPPSGWSRVRTSQVKDRLRLETFVKVAGSTEPATYTWTLPDWRRIAGGITTYRGVHTTSPVDAHDVLAAGDNGTVITAPSVTTSAPGSMLVHVAVIGAEAALSPPGGMTEAWEATGWRADNSRDVTISSSHSVQATEGPSGTRSATSTAAGPRIGALIALRPGDATPPPPPPPGDPVLLGAGGIASCASNGDEQTAALLDGIAGTVFTAGDNAYERGTAAEWANCYDPSWGRHKSRTRPVPGNHDYGTAGAAPYYSYFGAAAGEAGKGYYSYDLGAWHIVALNSQCSAVGGCHAGSPQETWLRADLAAHPSQCTAAVIHHPLFSSDNVEGSVARVRPLWNALYEAGAELVIGGHARVYERFAPQTPAGAADPDFGIIEFNVGTGGRGHAGFGAPLPNSIVRDRTSWGVLKLTLHSTSFDWEFVPVAGAALRDSGSGACHAAP